MIYGICVLEIKTLKEADISFLPYESNVSMCYLCLCIVLLLLYYSRVYEVELCVCTCVHVCVYLYVPVCVHVHAYHRSVCVCVYLKLLYTECSQTYVTWFAKTLNNLAFLKTQIFAWWCSKYLKLSSVAVSSLYYK